MSGNTDKQRKIYGAEKQRDHEMCEEVPETILLLGAFDKLVLIHR